MAIVKMMLHFLQLLKVPDVCCIYYAQGHIKGFFFVFLQKDR